MGERLLEDIVEIGARAIYDGRTAKLSSCWSWDDSGLDDEHPHERDNIYRDTEALFQALAKAGYVLVKVEPTDVLVLTHGRDKACAGRRRANDLLKPLKSA